MVTQSDPIKPKCFIDTNPYLTNKVLTTGADTILLIKARSRQPIAIDMETKDLKKSIYLGY